MNNYNQLYLQQLNPFLIIQTENESHKDLFQPYNINNCSWDNSILKNRMTTTKFIIQYKIGPTISITKESKTDHHSILSPFNPKSELYPNGILTHSWFDKYINQLPFAVVYIIQAQDSLNKIQTAESILKPLGITLIVLLLNGETTIEYIKQHTSVIVYTFEPDSESIKLLMGQLMYISHDYYKAIDYKIKQRYKKYYTTIENTTIQTNVALTPKFLEVRNLIKQSMIQQFINCSDLTYSLNLLELAYDILLSIISNIPRDLPFDLQLIAQFKTLLDVLCFHIVRGYFSIEESLKAFKFHKLHIINGDTTDNNWISLQYHWLAELVNMIPISISNIPNNKRNGIPYFGGVHLMQFDIISNPSLLLVKAYESLKDSPEKKIELLTKSLAWFTGSSSFIEYSNWLIGEEYHNLQQYAQAIQYFKSSHLDNFILYKLIVCYININDIKSALTNLIKLSLLPYKQLPPLEFNQTIELDLLDNFKLFSVDVILFGSEPIYVHDEITTQVKITSLTNLSKLLNSQVDVVINQIDIIVTTQGKHKGVKSISITHDNAKETCKITTLHGQELDESFVDSMNLLFVEPEKIIQHIQSSSYSGQFEIECIKLQSTIKFNSIILNKIEIYDNFPTRHHSTIYQDGIKFKKRSLSNSIKVLPIKPNISITLLKDIQTYILGERLAILLKIEYHQEKPVKLVVKGDLQWNWNNLKDDEPLPISSGTHILNVFTRTPQELLSLELTAMVDDDDDEVLIYEVANYIFPMINKPPFICDYIITPRYDDSNLPSPFIAETNMTSTRLWKGELDIVNELKLEIVDIDFTLIPSNPEIEIFKTTTDNNKVTFLTKSKSGIRNVNISTSSIIKYQRDSESPINEYALPDYQITLPLSDPRLLLHISHQDNHFTFKYILENPTARVFTFTSLLTSPHWNFEGNIVPLKQNPFPVLPFSKFVMDFHGEYIGEKGELVELPSMTVFDVQYKVTLPVLAVVDTVVVKSGELYYQDIEGEA